MGTALLRQNRELTASPLPSSIKEVILFMGLTILLMGFRLGRRGWARRLQIGAGATYVRPGHGSANFCLPCTLGQWSTWCVQGGPVVRLAPLEAASFGGREEGRLFRLPPRSPLYLVSLPARPSPRRVMFG